MPRSDAPVTDPDTQGRPDWAAYYRQTIEREPRPLFQRGMRAMAAAGMKPGQAIEVGFGDGTETVVLLGAGWSVLAIDATPHAAEVLGPQVTDGRRRSPRDPHRFCGDGRAARIRPALCGLRALVPRAGRLPHLLGSGSGADPPWWFIVVNIFGVHDTWASRPDAQRMTFLGESEFARCSTACRSSASTKRIRTATRSQDRSIGTSSTSWPDRRGKALHGAGLPVHHEA